MKMEKPYDGQVLLEALKKEGIEGGVETAKKVVSVLADFLRSSAQMSTEGLIGHLDDFAIPGINYFEKIGLQKLSEIEVSLAAVPSEPAPIELEKPADPAAPQS